MKVNYIANVKKSLTDDNDLNVAILGMAVIKPQISQRTINRELNTISQSIIQRILKANHFHAFHIHLHHAFIANKKRKRVNFVIGVWKNYRKTRFLTRFYLATNKLFKIPRN